jgi:hypothetical protein
MSHPDDIPRDDSGPARPERADLPLDEEAAWRAIVENYGERTVLDDVPDEPVAPSAAEPPARSVFDRGYLDAQEAAHRERSADRAEEDHFVPPEPPPVPRGTPARRLAWSGLFGAPLAMLVAVVLHVVFPPWLVLALVAAFVGGFVFLVATMPRDRGDWPGDDGAVV